MCVKSCEKWLDWNGSADVLGSVRMPAELIRTGLAIASAPASSGCKMFGGAPYSHCVHQGGAACWGINARRTLLGEKIKGRVSQFSLSALSAPFCLVSCSFSGSVRRRIERGHRAGEGT